MIEVDLNESVPSPQSVVRVGREVDINDSVEGQPTFNEKQRPGFNLERTLYQVGGGMLGGAAAAGAASPLAVPVGIGLGSAIAGQAYDRSMEAQGKQAPQTGMQALTTGTEDFIYDVVSPAALKAGIYGTKKAGSALINYTKSKVWPNVDIQKFINVGVKPTPGVALKSKGFGIAEQALGDFPLSAPPIQKLARENVEALKFSSQYLAEQYGDVLSKEELGTLLQHGATGAMERLSGVYNKLFSRVSKDIGDAPQALSKTADIISVLEKEAAKGPSTSVLKIGQDILEKAEAQGGGLPFESLKKFRTKIGDMMKDPFLVSTRDIQSGDLKRLYGALTEDMEAAAKAAGPQSHARWRAANKYFEISTNNKLPILEEIAKKRYSEDAYNILMKSSESGGSRLRLLRRQMPNDEWDAVSATIFGKLGMAKAGAQDAAGEVFSINTFMTNWNRLAPEAKKALWAGTKHQGLYKDLDEFASVIGDMKGVEALANKSRTGSILMFYGIFQALSGAAGQAAGGIPGAAAATVGSMVGGPYGAAKLITNQSFVKFLTQGVKIMKTDPNAMSVHLGRLFALREKEDIKDEVNSLISSITKE
jgi:hypothetical protein